MYGSALVLLPAGGGWSWCSVAVPAPGLGDCVPSTVLCHLPYGQDGPGVRPGAPACAAAELLARSELPVLPAARCSGSGARGPLSFRAPHSLGTGATRGTGQGMSAATGSSSITPFQVGCGVLEPHLPPLPPCTVGSVPPGAMEPCCPLHPLRRGPALQPLRGAAGGCRHLRLRG